MITTYASAQASASQSGSAAALGLSASVERTSAAEGGAADGAGPLRARFCLAAAPPHPGAARPAPFFSGRRAANTSSSESLLLPEAGALCRIDAAESAMACASSSSDDSEALIRVWGNSSSQDVTLAAEAIHRVIVKVYPGADWRGAGLPRRVGQTKSFNPPRMMRLSLCKYLYSLAISRP